MRRGVSFNDTGQHIVLVSFLVTMTKQFKERMVSLYSQVKSTSIMRGKGWHDDSMMQLDTLYPQA